MSCKIVGSCCQGVLLRNRSLKDKRRCIEAKREKANNNISIKRKSLERRESSNMRERGTDICDARDEEKLIEWPRDREINRVELEEERMMTKNIEICKK